MRPKISFISIKCTLHWKPIYIKLNQQKWLNTKTGLSCLHYTNGLHDVIVRVVEHRVLGGDVCSHVVGER